MTRSTRLGLIAATVLLLALGGAYTAYWLIAAGQLRDGIAAWSEAMRGQGLDASWQAARVRGYPFAFRLELTDVHLRGEAPASDVDLRTPTLTGSIRPWNFRDWSLAAPQHLDTALADRRVPLARIAAESATGAVSVASDGDGGITIWLNLADATAEPAADPAARVTAATASFWLILPGRPAHADTDRSLGFAADLHGVGVPGAPAPFTARIDDFGFGATVMGAVPAAPPRQAAEAWRQSGGTVELDHLDLSWGGLRIGGSGTVALGADLQPVGAFSAAIEGYDQLLAAMNAAGLLRPREAGIARVALALLAKSGPDGKPRLETSFTIQNGQMYLGPVKLGPAPPIDWP